MSQKGFQGYLPFRSYVQYPQGGSRLSLASHQLTTSKSQDMTLPCGKLMLPDVGL
jgi:hypothetical protein